MGRQQEETLENTGMDYRITVYKSQPWTDPAKDALHRQMDEHKILRAIVEAAAKLLPGGVGLIVEADILDDQVDYQDEYRVRKPACGPLKVKIVRPVHVGAVD